MTLSQSMEDYLKAVYKLQTATERVPTSAVASALEVSNASATNMLQRLAELHLLTYERYRGVELTAAGRRAALEIIRHHRLIELYLQQALGYRLDEVDAEAERLEHAISQDFAARIEQLLGHPTHDPHGHPIPNGNLELPESGGIALGAVAAVGQLRIVAVEDRNPAFLRRLAALGLLPGETVEVLAVAAADGSVLIRLSGDELRLPGELAAHVTVVA
ncbi:MAG: metal-dependent transcriptional regulator [Fimbriimonadaceae bacterium]|nr:metal-dependent transcriptional regulator [Fimbriimonadaceae bacterium]